MIRMWAAGTPYPQLLHRGLKEPVSSLECVTRVWPIRSLAKVTLAWLLHESVVCRHMCGRTTRISFSVGSSLIAAFYEVVSECVA